MLKLTITAYLVTMPKRYKLIGSVGLLQSEETAYPSRITPAPAAL